MLDATRTALILIDVQMGFAEIEAAGARRNNKQAEARIGDLLAFCRERGVTIIHVRHASTEAGSPFRPDRSGFAVNPVALERPGEAVIVKAVNSAFIGTDLEARLRQAGIRHLAIAGVTTNHCVETTTRMAGNLGFDAYLVEDACWTFDRTGPDGRRHGAEDVHAMTLANLHGEFATVVRTQDMLGRIAINH